MGNFIIKAFVFLVTLCVNLRFLDEFHVFVRDTRPARSIVGSERELDIHFSVAMLFCLVFLLSQIKMVDNATNALFQFFRRGMPLADLFDQREVIYIDQNALLLQVTPDLTRYLGSFGSEESFLNAVTRLDIPDSAIEQFIEPIYKEMPEIPVLLSGEIFDFKKLLHATEANQQNGKRINPITRDIFYVRDIHPAWRIKQAIKYMIKDIERAERKITKTDGFFSQANLNQAERKLKQAITIYEKYNYKNELLATYYYKLSIISDKLNYLPEAINYCEKCLKLRKELFPNEHNIISITQEKLNELQQRLKDDNPNFEISILGV